jgi:hypothetical protein
MLKYTIFATVVFVILSASAAGETAIEYPTDDAYVSEYHQKTNFGTEQILLLGIDGAIDDRITFIKFDLSPYYGETISSAYLFLYITKLEHNVPNASWHITGVYADWDEKDVNWVNMPGGAQPTDSLDAPSTTGWWTIDVTDAIQDIVDGTYDYYGFRLYGDYYLCALITLSSKEGTAEPMLAINYPTSVESASLGEIKAAFK